MNCFNSRHFVDYLHSLNGNCSCSIGNNTAAAAVHHPVTSSIYIASAILCFLLGLVTHLRYNRIEVLNITVRSSVISNVPWIFYFILMCLRSVAGSVVYAIIEEHDKGHPEILAAYFMADAALKSLEVLCLSWALNHQFLYRSQGFLQEEINNYNSEEFRASDSYQHLSVVSATAMSIKKNKAGAIFVTQFILAVLFMVILEDLHLSKEQPDIFYWLYISLFWTQCITPVVLVILIAVNKNEDGPTLSVKLLCIAGVILSLPADIPSFVWSCTCNCKPKCFFTGYDFALFFLIPSTIIFFIVLRAEYLRLDQEAKYSVLRQEVISQWSVHSETILPS
ncbi:uncharacterized protein [Montipora capricornis]|uniref:uncharacterized protein isoform X1 n=1 Tax=Montipora capricornis TaxID=246305 RepID=UPI0035F1105E